MLENSCSSGDEEEDQLGITEEELQKYRVNQKLLESQRNELRVQLRQNFDRMRLRRCPCVHGASTAVQRAQSPLA